MRISLTPGVLLALGIISAPLTSVRGDLVYVSNFSNDSVYQLDAATGTLLNTYSAPGFLDSPTGVALSPDGSTLYVSGTNASNADVYVFDTASGALVDQFLTGATGARGLALTSDGGTLYASFLGNDSIVPFNTTTGTAGTAIVGGGLSDPQGLHVGPSDNTLFIANSSANNALQISIPTPSLIETYTAPLSFYSPSDVVLSPDGETLYVSTFGDSAATNNQVLRFDVDDGTFLGSWTVPDPAGDLYGMTINPDGSTLYVADIFNSRILTIDTATGVATPFSTDATLSNPAFLVYVETTAAVPEPSILLLLGMAGGTGLIGARWRRRRLRAD